MPRQKNPAPGPGIAPGLVSAQGEGIEVVRVTGNPILGAFLFSLRGKQVTSYETLWERLSRESFCCLHFCYYRFHQ